MACEALRTQLQGFLHRDLFEAQLLFDSTLQPYQDLHFACLNVNVNENQNQELHLCERKTNQSNAMDVLERKRMQYQHIQYRRTSLQYGNK